MQKQPPAMRMVLRSPVRWLATAIIALVAAGLAPAGPASVAATIPQHPTNAQLVSRSDGERPPMPPGITTNTDVSVTGPTPGIEDEPSIAIDPSDPSNVIVGVQRLAGPCTYYESSDGGATWSDALIAPLTPGAGICYDIVARASPDGRFFYLSYLSIANETTDDVAVLRITTDFVTTQGPFVAIPQRPGLIDKDWIDVHGLDSEHPNEVFLTATHFHVAPGCTVLFTRSIDYGKHWSTPSILANYPECTVTDVGGLAPARSVGSVRTSWCVGTATARTAGGLRTGAEGSSTSCAAPRWTTD